MLDYEREHEHEKKRPGGTLEWVTSWIRTRGRGNPSPSRVA